MREELWKHFSPASWQRFVDEQRTAQRKLAGEGRSLHEALVYQILRRSSDLGAGVVPSLRRRVKNGARRLGHKLSRRVVVGTVPTGEVNAHAFKVGKGWVAVVDHGSLLFIWLMAKLVSSQIEVSDERRRPPVKLPPAPQELAIERILDLVFYYVAFGDPWFAPPYWPERNHEFMLGTLAANAETFLLAHEVAHILLGHLDAHETESARRADEKQQELDADWLATKIVVSIRELMGVDFTLRYTGLELFFWCLEIIEGASGEGSSDSHPSATERLMAVRANVTNHFPAGASAVAFAENMRQRVMEIWTQARLRLESRKEPYQEWMISWAKRAAAESPCQDCKVLAREMLSGSSKN